MNRRLRRRCAAACLALAAGAPAAADDLPAVRSPPAAPAVDPAGAAVDPAGAAGDRATAVVQQPRPFGYTIGDIVTQRVLLQRNGRAFEPAALPAPGRVGAWLERRAPRLERAADGRQWLVVDYQLINAPQALRAIALPAWRVAPRHAGAALEVPAWHLSVAPLTPRWAIGESGLDALLPDRPAPAVETAPLHRQRTAWSAAAASTALAWLGWLLWRRRRAAAHQPFARAWRELRAVDDGTPDAWQALHRAFDRTAGRVVQTATLPALFERAPHLQPMRFDIERFYAESQALFFGASRAAPTLSPRALCRALLRLETRHEQ